MDESIKESIKARHSSFVNSYEIEDGPGGEEIYTCGDLNLDNRCSYSSSLSY